MIRILCCAVLLGLFHTPIFGQRDPMIELYGEGVHRYFAADYHGTDQVLSTVIDSGYNDPRVFYFRGLAREALGFGGDIDFESGAQLEAQGRRVVDVGSALIRVQGQTRAKIEKARQDARVALRTNQLLMDQSRRLAEEGDADAVRSEVPAPAIPDAADPFGGDSTDPFGAPEPATPSTMVEPTTPEVSDTVNPFGDEPGDVPAPATEPMTDPFPEAPAGAVDDPFGPADPAMPLDTSDPFGTPVEPPANPFDAPEGGDPFGV
jgi:hypothetical protein